jgi:hypothetical protein
LVTRSRTPMTSAGSGQTRCLYSDPISGLTSFARTGPDYLALSSRLLPDCISSDAQAFAGSMADQLTSYYSQTCLPVHSFSIDCARLIWVIVRCGGRRSASLLEAACCEIMTWCLLYAPSSRQMWGRNMYTKRVIAPESIVGGHRCQAIRQHKLWFQRLSLSCEEIPWARNKDLTKAEGSGSSACP